MHVQIVNPQLYAPPKVQTAAELSPLVGRSENWIRSRTGVERRHINEESPDLMSGRVARAVIGDGPPPDLVINASLTPRQLIPDTSPFVLRAAGWEGIPAFSIHATCLSFLVALHTASSLVSAGAYRRVLVVSAESGTVSRNFAEPESAVLIGDGAAGALVVPTPEGADSAMLAYHFTTWPDGAELTEIRGFGFRNHPNSPDTKPEDNLFHMNGPAIYRKAIRRVHAVLDAVEAQSGIKRGDIDLIVPHQASGPALGVLPRFGLPADKIVSVIAEYGNCVAASIPMALAHAHAQGRLQRGMTVLFIGTGAGLGVGAAIVRW